MSTELVYRVQHHETGEGPYGDFHEAVDGILYAHNDDKHPGPRNPISGLKNTWSVGQLFGFRSREQLDEWFKGWKYRLHSAGYVIKVFKVQEDMICHGVQQLCFWPEGVLEEVETLSTVRRWKPATEPSSAGRMGTEPEEPDEAEEEFDYFDVVLRAFGSFTFVA